MIAPTEKPHDQLSPETLEFYRRVMTRLQEARVPFLVGGAYAFARYTGIVRHTKDFDIFVHPRDFDRTLEELKRMGCSVERPFPHWLGKGYWGDDFVDVIFGAGNGIARVDDLWFEHAMDEEVLGIPSRLCPAEEMIWSKAFIQERERFDGADVMHLIRHCAEIIEWERLLRRFDRYWPLLLTYLVMFTFIYPSEKHRIPQPVFEDLLGRLQQQLKAGENGAERVCQGTLVSRGQYMVDIGQYGFADARLVPRGNMSPEDAIYWTWAIENVD
jgi:hypothetical protein